MKKLNLLLALALLFGVKAFAQDGKENKPSDLPRAPQQWAYTYEYDEVSDSVVTIYSEVYELHDGRILVSGCSIKRNECGVLIGTHIDSDAAILALDADGTELCHYNYHKDGYRSGHPYVLENNEGEAFLLFNYDIDVDTCSSNYYKNFYPPTDHCILGLYKLNDDLSIAESYEWNIPVDTSGFGTLLPVGQYDGMEMFSAMVDSDGYIVGGYSKFVNFHLHPQALDSVFFFKMDFDGNMVKRVGYETNHAYCGADTFYHMVEADSLYVYYGYAGDVGDNGNRNLFYLDKEFNVVSKRRYLHAVQLPGIQGQRSFFQIPNVMRSPNGTTYMTCMANENRVSKNYSSCILYEFDDCSSFWDAVPIKRFIERKTGNWDLSAPRKGVAIANDNSLYYTYSLNIGFYENLDSWIQIEHLTPEFDVISAVYYDLPGEMMHSHASSITVTEDGGVLLTLRGYDMNMPNSRYESVVKFPAEAFLGVDEAHANGLSLAIAYPNPGHDVLNIRTTVENAAVEVYDMNGRLVAQQPVTETETVLDATDWAAGTYVWKVVSGVSTSSTTLIESGKWIKE